MSRLIAGVFLSGLFFQVVTGTKNKGVNTLLKLGPKITVDAASERNELKGMTMRDVTHPTLTELGGVRLGMRQQEVLSTLSAPLEKAETDDGTKWTYKHPNGAVLSVEFDQSGTVSHIASDAIDVSIPNHLRAGLLLEQFEAVYGGQQVRKSQRLGLDQRLVEYPMSHLALIVSSEGNRVDSLMVFK